MKPELQDFSIKKLIENCKLKIDPSSKGFTLLFAVLVGSLLFAMGIAIANLAIKEIILSAAGKESETAFFAADTGTECALYWDLRVSGTFPNSQTSPKDPDNTIQCNGANVALSYAWTATAATTTFRLGLGSESCAEVRVGKTANPARTIIESRGRNDADCANTDSNPARGERAPRGRY